MGGEHGHQLTISGLETCILEAAQSIEYTTAKSRRWEANQIPTEEALLRNQLRHELRNPDERKDIKKRYQSMRRKRLREKANNQMKHLSDTKFKTWRPLTQLEVGGVLLHNPEEWKVGA